MTKKPFKPEIVDDKQESVNNPIEQVSRPTKLIYKMTIAPFLEMKMMTPTEPK